MFTYQYKKTKQIKNINSLQQHFTDSLKHIKFNFNSIFLFFYSLNVSHIF